MPLQGRVTSWTGFPEWQYVADRIYSADVVELEKALILLDAWITRGNHPPAIETTYNIRRIMLMMEQGELDNACARLALSSTLVRFVNEVVDPQQQASYALPVTQLAERSNLPRLLVDIRHAATHDNLPNLETLLIGAELALKWLKEYYWDVRRNYAATVREAVIKMLDRYIEGMQSGGGARAIDGWPSRCLSEVQSLDSSQDIQVLFLESVLEYKCPLNDLLLLVDSLGAKDDSLALAFMSIEEPGDLNKYNALFGRAASRIKTLRTLTVCVKQCYLNIEGNGIASAETIARHHQVANVPDKLQELINVLLSSGKATLSDNDLLGRTEALLKRDSDISKEPNAPAGWHQPRDWVPVPLGMTLTFNPITDFLRLYDVSKHVTLDM